MQSRGVTKWIDTNKTFKRKPMQISSRLVVLEFNSGDWPDKYAGTLLLGALKAMVSIASHHKQTFSIMHIRRVSCILPRKSSEVRLPMEDRSGVDVGNFGLLRKIMNWERDWQDHVKRWGVLLRLSSKKLCRYEEHKVSGMTHGYDSREWAGEQEEWCITMIPDLPRCLRKISDSDTTIRCGLQQCMTRQVKNQSHRTKHNPATTDRKLRMFVPQSISGRHNSHHEPAVPTHVKPTQHCGQIFAARKAVGICFNCGKCVKWVQQGATQIGQAARRDERPQMRACYCSAVTC